VASLCVLDEAALTRLRLAYQKRLATAQAVGVPPDPHTEERRNAVSLLGRALSGQTPAILLIDGHNVLFGLPAATTRRARRCRDRRGKASASDGRRRADRRPQSVAARLGVFDGPNRSDAQAAPNVRVTYSGGTGEHRADAVLVDNLRFFKSTRPRADGLPREQRCSPLRNGPTAWRGKRRRSRFRRFSLSAAPIVLRAAC
jgi:hypothetical protein